MAGLAGHQQRVSGFDFAAAGEAIEGGIQPGGVGGGGAAVVLGVGGKQDFGPFLDAHHRVSPRQGWKICPNLFVGQIAAGMGGGGMAAALGGERDPEGSLGGSKQGPVAPTGVQRQQLAGGRIIERVGHVIRTGAEDQQRAALVDTTGNDLPSAG